MKTYTVVFQHEDGFLDDVDIEAESREDAIATALLTRDIYHISSVVEQPA